MAIPIEQILNHAEAAVERLAQQYRWEENEGLVRAFVDQFQDIEDAAFPMLLLSSIDDSEGDQLDRIGLIVGQLRIGTSDAEYRSLLHARILINTSSGDVERLIAISALIDTEHGAYRFRDYPPASLLVRAGEDWGVEVPDFYLGLLREAKQSGVSLSMIYAPSPFDETFTLGDADAPSSSDDQGCGDASDPLVGGTLTGII